MRTCCVAVLAGGVRRLLSPRRVRVRLVVAWLPLRVVAWLLTAMLLVRVPVLLRLGWLVLMVHRSPALVRLPLMLLVGLLLVLPVG